MDKNWLVAVVVDVVAVIAVVAVAAVVVLFLLRVIHLTESGWLNEHDRKSWTWPKNLQQRTITFELHQKYN